MERLAEDMGDITIERVGLDRLDPTMNPFQSQFWAHLKRPSGWRAFAFRITSEGVEGDTHTVVFLVLVRRLLLGFRLAYIPFAPPLQELAGDTSLLIGMLARRLRPLLPKGTAFVRFDLPWNQPESLELPTIAGKNLRVCRESVQPEGTARISLVEGYEHVRMRYRERARRNIRKARAHGIVVRNWNGSEKSFLAWYNVYLETAKRDGFSARPASYIRHLLAIETPGVSSHLYIAYKGGAILGGALIVSSQAVSVYLYGASLRVEGCSPSYLLQDHAIREACSRGGEIYDLFGISGPGGRGGHLEGLRLFKRAFGGYVCYRSPSIDYVYRHLIRFLYTRLEQMRYHSHRKRQPARMAQQYSVAREE